MKNDITESLNKAIKSCKTSEELDAVWSERFLPYLDKVKDACQVIYTDKRNEITGNVSN